MQAIIIIVGVLIIVFFFPFVVVYFNTSDRIKLMVKSLEKISAAESTRTADLATIRGILEKAYPEAAVAAKKEA